MTGEVVSIAKNEYEQGSFDGFPIAETRYALKSKALMTDKKLGLFQNVTGTFAGRIRSVSFDEQGEQSLKRVFVLEVLEAQLDA